MRDFKQVDVFTSGAHLGNPVAVVFVDDADDAPSTESMQRFAHWTNLSETTFVLPPTHAHADYRLRIFTPANELPFAGHPTLGSCHAWLERGGTPRTAGRVVQECAHGNIPIRRGEQLAFAAPPLIRGGEVEEEDLALAMSVLRVARDEVVKAQWCDNGPGWMALMLQSAERVLAIEPDFGAVESYDIGVAGKHTLGVVGPHKLGAVALTGPEPAIEVRAFFRSGGTPAEDPVTGSLNAALAMWLLGDGTLTAPYVAAQGTALGRAGRVYVEQADGEIWIGGETVTCVDGRVRV